jgi:hypothetical protein
MASLLGMMLHTFKSEWTSSLATRAVSNIIESRLQMAIFGKSRIVVLSESQGIESSTGDVEIVARRP